MIYLQFFDIEKRTFEAEKARGAKIESFFKSAPRKTFAPFIGLERYV
jgi:hypothetical protein